MKRGTKLAIGISAIVFGVGILIVAAVTMVTGGVFSMNWNMTSGRGPEFTHYSFFDTEWGRNEHNSEKRAANVDSNTMTLEAFDEIEISVACLDVELIAADSFKVEYSINGQSEELKTCEVQNGKFVFKTKTIPVIGFFGVGFEPDDMNYVRLYYKAGTDMNGVNISSVSGDVSSEDTVRADMLGVTTTSGDMEVKNISTDIAAFATVSGSCELENVSIKNNLEFASTSGNFYAERIKAESAEMSTVSGKLEAYECTFSGIEAESTSGNITADGALSGENRFSTVSGDVEMSTSLLQNDYSVSTSTVSGDCRVGGNEMKGSSGNGSNKINAETVSGDITISFE